MINKKRTQPVRLSSRAFMLAGCSVVGLLGASSLAYAEQTAADETTVSDAGTASKGTYVIEDIVVTAQKRSESLQKTPAAVTAYSGISLVEKGVTDLRAAQTIIPNARLQQEGATTQAFLRGVGSNLDYSNIEPTIAFNFNGVFIPREGTSAPLFDLERLEALPGPQGTLYGRSALGGTINVAFKRPTPGEWETSGVVEAGNYDMVHVSLAQNIPVSDTLAVRAAADYTYNEGFMETGAYSKDDIAGRLSLLYTPSSDVSLYMWGYGVSKDGRPSNLVNKGTDPETFEYSENEFLRDRAWDDLRPGPLAALAPFGQPVAESQVYDNWVAGAELEIALGDNMSLTYIPSYFYLDSSSSYWLGAVPARISQHYNQVTQELRLAGDTDNLTWLVGLYAYHVVNYGDYFVLPGTAFETRSSDVLRNRIKGAAVFGQATYSVSDTFRLTFGGRYSKDDKKANGVSPLDGADYTFDRDFSRFDFKVGTEYDVSDSVMVYLTYQTGYLPGTYNEVAATATDDNLVKPAKLSAFTGGFKARFMDGQLQINSEAYYYSYTDLLIQAYDQSKAYNPIFNADKVEIYGNQLDIIFKPSASDTLSLNVGYLHARNKDFITPESDDFTGFSPPYAADWTIMGNYAHDFETAGGFIRAQADARYESEWYADYVHNLGVRQQPHVKSNATLTYYPDDSNWTLGLWIKNITNEAVLAATAAAGIPGPGTAYLEEPRTFGIRFTFDY
ncbi:TonB-dependent receptor [Kordiimonas pumila]|uniref:TonB-dependent receptor n=1 Tax=Kordiimonas pumila TaxID=2161677 RepID=A0ABV7D6X0_9PROT|nr:TonB-dependent receptor [Kordiimonas pumila]